MSGTVLGSRLMVRNSLVAYSATPPASSVEVPRYRGPSSSRQLPVVSVLFAASVTCTTVKAQPGLSSRRRSPQTGRVHSAQFFLQVGDLVAEPGGQFELQVPRR